MRDVRELWKKITYRVKRVTHTPSQYELRQRHFAAKPADPEIIADRRTEALGA